MTDKPKKKTVADYPELVAQWHPTKNGELRPGDFTAGSDKKAWWKCPKGPDHEWPASVGSRAKRGAGVGCPYCRGFRASITNSLAALHPKIAAQWHPSKNGDVTPEHVVAGSCKKYWWKCLEGPDHVWPATPDKRTNGRGCPFCSGRRVSVTNSLATIAPKVAKQWHPTKNGDLTPEQFVAGSTKKVWWKCPKGPDHEWSASVRTRSIGNGCGFCRGLRISVTNSLATRAPELAMQWHPTKNGDLSPEQVVVGSHKKVWWKCPEGPDHEWPAVVKDRANGNGCGFCDGNGQRVSITNSLATLHPEIAKQWHPTKNGDLTPEQVVAGSAKKVWWKCPEGPDHEWRTGVRFRGQRGTNCPYCEGIRVSITNSLATLHPEIARQWHPTKNGDLTSEHVVAGSNKKVWWKCPEGPDHEWPTTVVSRTQGTDCGFCAGQRLSVTNSLATCAPEIAKQWHPTKNGDLTPEQVISGSHKKVWWKCPEGPDHVWPTTISNRKQGHNCGFCEGLRVSVTNSLATCAPVIAKQWHPTKNGDLTPEQVVARSSIKVWWKCASGPDHEWPTTIEKRTGRGDGCPLCSIVPRSKQEIRLAFELAHHIPIDHEFHKIKTARRLWDVDICSPDLKLVIEFDGSFWHAEKGEKDRAKAKNLRHNGWRVVRVREAPLKKLSKWNVVIPTNADAHEAALLVLEHLQSVLDLDIPRMDERQAAEGPLCAKEAEAYIEKLLAEKQAAEAQ